MKKTTFYLAILATIVVTSVFLKWWLDEIRNITQYSINAWSEEQQAECAIVLTGGPNRVSEGFNLLYQKNVKKLMISGVNPDSHIEQIYPNIMFYGRIEPDTIILEKNSKTTYGNAQHTLPLVEALQCHDIILITSQLHMYRAYTTFRNHYPEHIKIYPRATVGRNYQHHWLQIVHESIKSLFYSLWAY